MIHKFRINNFVFKYFKGLYIDVIKNGILVDVIHQAQINKTCKDSKDDDCSGSELFELVCREWYNDHHTDCNQQTYRE